MWSVEPSTFVGVVVEVVRAVGPELGRAEVTPAAWADGVSSRDWFGRGRPPGVAAVGTWLDWLRPRWGEVGQPDRVGCLGHTSVTPDLGVT